MSLLTDTAIRSTKPGADPIKLFDGGGLYLLITPTGSRLWRMKYRVHRREKTLSFGSYPDVSLKTAREHREDAKRQLGAGLDPSVQKKLRQNAGVNTFKAVAIEWLNQLENPPQNLKRSSRRPLAKKTLERKRGWLKDYVFPEIGSRPIDHIESPEMLDVLRRVEKHGFFETTIAYVQPVAASFATPSPPTDASAIPQLICAARSNQSLSRTTPRSRILVRSEVCYALSMVIAANRSRALHSDWCLCISSVPKTIDSADGTRSTSMRANGACRRGG